MANKIVNEKYGEFVGSGMRPKFIKEKVDLTHIRGYAVLMVRVTPPDAPDSKAIYNMYQVDAGIARASGELYKALQKLVADGIVYEGGGHDEVFTALAKADKIPRG